MKKTQLVSALIALTVLPSFALREKVDGIAAIIGNEIILQSEVDAYTLMRLNGLNIKPDSVDASKYRRQFLEELIEGKVLVAHAKQDTNIVVSNDEVDKTVENHIQMIIRQNKISSDSLESELKKQGMSLAKFRAETRKAVRDQLLKQKVQQSYLMGIKVGRREVEDFYKQYKDSLPAAGESVLLSQLTVKITANDSVRQKSYERIKTVRQRISEGASFEEMAKKYSESPEAESGGDLGFIAKGSLGELVFEEKAFSLGTGEVSEPFETRLGFHILKVVEKRDRMVHIRQIFIKVAPPEQQIKAITDRLDSIKTNCKTPDEFVKSVKKYSADPGSKARNGRIGWKLLLELQGELHSALDSLKAGEISVPVRDGNSLSIYRVDDRVASRKLTLEDDYPALAEKAKDIIAQKKLLDLVTKWRQEIYVDVRM